MFEKSILVVYLNIDNLTLKDAISSTQSTIHYLETEFSNDPDLKCIVAPVKNQPTKIELLNSKYPNWQEFQERLPELIQQMENYKIDNNI